jgi:hypothetical protein
MEWTELMEKSIDLWYFHDAEQAIGIIPHPIDVVVAHYTSLIRTTFTKFSLYPYEHFNDKSFYYDIKYLIASGITAPNKQKVTYWIPDKHGPLLIEIEGFDNLVIAIAPRIPHAPGDTPAP